MPHARQLTVITANLPATRTGAAPAASFAASRPDRTFLELGALAGAVPSARLHARLVMLERGLGALSDDTELVVAGLVINGVRASRAMGRAAVRMWPVSNLGHLASNPVDRILWTTPAVAASVDRRVVVSPTQARNLLAAVRALSGRGQHREAFFACLYYAALRPSEAVMFRETCTAPPDGRIFQTARGGILQDSGYNEVWTEARKIALIPAQQR